jgi:cell division protein FtsI/penicillin-binding protein 2
LGGAAVLFVLSRTQQGQQATGGALSFLNVETSRLGALVSSRGYANNNPLNMRFLTSGAWNGQVANDGGFAVYDTPQNGTRAAGRQLRKYFAAGRRTVRDIVSTWAPSSENDTDAYVNDVAGELDVDADSDDVSGMLPDLVRAMAKHENGYVDSSYDWNWALL